MFAEYFEHGGPVMYAIFVAWVVVLAGVLDRLAYVAARLVRRPHRRLVALAAAGRPGSARCGFAAEQARAARGLDRIDAVSQLATSLGLFGTVLGLARALFARGSELELAAPDVLASGLATALFTTVGGLVVFLFGQAFLIVYREWQAYGDRRVEAAIEVPE